MTDSRSDEALDIIRSAPLKAVAAYRNPSRESVSPPRPKGGGRTGGEFNFLKTAINFHAIQYYSCHCGSSGPQRVRRATDIGPFIGDDRGMWTRVSPLILYPLSGWARLISKMSQPVHTPYHPSTVIQPRWTSPQLQYNDAPTTYAPPEVHLGTDDQLVINSPTKHLLLQNSIAPSRLPQFSP